MSQYASLLGAVTIDSSNNAIRMVEGATTATVLVAAGTYFLRGDGASDDLLLACKTAFDSHPNATSPNTYTVQVSSAINPAVPSCTVTVTGGIATFQLSWADALTTFDPGVLGFTPVNTANNASAKSSTLSPSLRWVSTDVVESFEPEAEYDVSVMRARSGRVRGVRRGGPYDLRRVVLRYQDSRRVLATDNVADPNASFARFLQRHGDGTRFELHTALAPSGVVAALGPSTRVGVAWVFDEPTSSMFAPDRVEPGLALYDWELGLLGWVP